MLNTKKQAKATLKRLDNSVGPIRGIVEQPRLELAHATGRPRRPKDHPLDGTLDFLGLRSRGPTAESTCSSNRLEWAWAGSSSGAVTAVVSTASLWMTLAKSPARAASDAWRWSII